MRSSVLRDTTNFVFNTQTQSNSKNIDNSETFQSKTI
jgi:hypothetical protein